MIPPIDHPVWVQFVTGKKTITSSKATINLLVQNNKMGYERDASPGNTRELISRAHKFFTQFESIFPNEIAQITG
jgi:plasmid stabilization system protein ParE